MVCISERSFTNDWQGTLECIKDGCDGQINFEKNDDELVAR